MTSIANLPKSRSLSFLDFEHTHTSLFNISTFLLSSLIIMQLTLSSTVAIVNVLASLTMAMPTGPGDLTPITQAEVREIEKRFQGNYQDYLPGCEIDPSYAPGKSHFNDGDGVSFSSGCDNGMTTAAVSRFHCW